MSLTIAISACLLGTPCRYDGQSKPCPAAQSLSQLTNVAVVPICPEVAGGLPTPRTPNEIVGTGTTRRVVDAEGIDHTDAFVAGAQATLERIRTTGCKAAILKAKSPSCGIGRIYDGSFTGTLVPGDGVAAQMVAKAGIPAFTEAELTGLWDQAGAEGIVRLLGEIASTEGYAAAKPEQTP